MIAIILDIGTGVCLLSALLCLYRIVFGPTFPDRVVALDMLVIVLIALLTLFGLSENTAVYVDGALSLAVLSFVGTIALARYSERGKIL